MPVPVSDFQIISAALVRFQYVEFSDIKHNAFAVGGCNTPFAPVSVLLPRFRRITENATVFLQGLSTSLKTIKSSKDTDLHISFSHFKYNYCSSRKTPHRLNRKSKSNMLLHKNTVAFDLSSENNHMKYF